MMKWIRLLAFMAGAMLFATGCQGGNTGKSTGAIIPPAERDFSFYQFSDVHIEPAYAMPTEYKDLRSFSCVQAAKNLAPIQMLPYAVTAPKPSFALVTGDVTEFGYAGATWQVFDQYFGDFGIPVHCVAGNHDNTWVSATREYRKRFDGQNYSFDYAGCHFVGLNSATLQDPVPSFGQEVIEFLRRDIESTPPSTPVFVFFHHPLYIDEFCSNYDSDRVVDLLHERNVVLALDGHGHSAVHHKYPGFDGVEGGSTFGAKSGFNVVYVKGSKLYAAYTRCEDSTTTKGLVQLDIPERSAYPTVKIESPRPFEEIRDGALKISASIAGSDKPLQAEFDLDDEKELGGELAVDGGKFTKNVDISKLVNGAHFLRVRFVEGKKTLAQKSAAFFVERSGQGKAEARWRFQMAGGSKAAPLAYNGMIYVGANDGEFYALNAKTGKLEWKYNAGAEILTSAAVWKDRILFGDGHGKFHALTPQGQELWSVDIGAAVYSSPVVDDEGNVFFGNQAAELCAVRAETGQILWKNKDARQSIESQPFVHGGAVLYGAWDGYLYAADRKTGKTLWKSPGPKNQKTVNRYYAPADNGPVAVGGRIYIADRGYIAGEYSESGDFIKRISADCAALTPSVDRKALYLRGLKTPLLKLGLDGKELWNSNVVLGRIPVSPTEKDGFVYACSNSGRLSAVDAKTGKTAWDYQVSPQLYVMSGVGAAEGVVFTSGLDGWVTAIAAPPAAAQAASR